MSDHLALDPRESLSVEIKRITCDLIDRGLEHIRTVREDPDTAVHEIRKRLKELRAGVRIIRSEIGERGYRMENFRLRDTGRLLSPARDSAVLVATLAELRNQPDAHEIARELDVTQEILVQGHRAEMNRLDSEKVLELVAENLKALQRRVELWQIRRGDFSAVRDGLEGVYTDGLRSMLRARKNPIDPHLHEWRKHVKYLWYQARMLAPAWPAVLNGMAESLHELSDALGLDHDLAVLSEACRVQLSPTCDPFLPLLQPLIRRQREATRRKVWLLGVRIYAEKPEAFVSRMKTYWRTGTQPC